MRDVLVVYQKEVKELLLGSDGWRSRVLQVFVLVAMFGVIMPLQAGPAVIQVIPYFALVAPLFLSAAIVADSFAGERERGTLEALLATRLPDRAIFFGKVLTAVTYAWVLSLLILLSALTIPNVMLLRRGEGLFMYPTSALLVGVIGSLLVALLAAGVGVLISLRARTVRGAVEAFTLPLLIVGVAVALLRPVLTRLVGDWLTRLPAKATLLLAFTFLAVLDVVLLSLAARSFRRDRLIIH